jgi:hypothetical protein
MGTQISFFKHIGYGVDRLLSCEVLPPFAEVFVGDGPRAVPLVCTEAETEHYPSPVAALRAYGLPLPRRNQATPTATRAPTIGPTR